MELRIPFTNLSLRMNLSAKSDGRWLGSADDLGTVFNGRVTEEKALGIDAVFACVNFMPYSCIYALLLYEKTHDGKRRAVNPSVIPPVA